jgi:hypothetical protein
MNSQEFCYWLQGFFEIQEPQKINAKQTNTIKEHLKLVFQYDLEPYAFCNFLNGYLSLENPTEISIEKTKIIQTYLDNVFTHVIETTNKKTDIEVAPISHTNQNSNSRLQILC